MPDGPEPDANEARTEIHINLSDALQGWVQNFNGMGQTFTEAAAALHSAWDGLSVQDVAEALVSAMPAIDPPNRRENFATFHETNNATPAESEGVWHFAEPLRGSMPLLRHQEFTPHTDFPRTGNYEHIGHELSGNLGIDADQARAQRNRRRELETRRRTLRQGLDERVAAPTTPQFRRDLNQRIRELEQEQRSAAEVRERSENTLDPAAAIPYNMDSDRGGHAEVPEQERQMRFDNTRKFGIEIEFTTRDRDGNHISTQDVADWLRQAGIRCTYSGYDHQTRPHWNCKTDSSCGLELVSPPLSGAGALDEVQRVLQVLNEHGVTINRQCGLHVHHDVHDLTLEQAKRLYALYLKYEPAIDELHPPSRQGNNNQFCISLAGYYGHDQVMRQIKEARTIDELARIAGTRYVKLNWQSFVLRGTVEFRQHAGTTSFEKIKHWVVLTQAMINRARDARVPFEVNGQDYSSFRECMTFGTGVGRSDEPCKAALAFYKARRRQLRRAAAA